MEKKNIPPPEILAKIKKIIYEKLFPEIQKYILYEFNGLNEEKSKISVPTPSPKNVLEELNKVIKDFVEGKGEISKNPSFSQIGDDDIPSEVEIKQYSEEQEQYFRDLARRVREQRREEQRGERPLIRDIIRERTFSEGDR